MFEWGQIHCCCCCCKVKRTMDDQAFGFGCIDASKGQRKLLVRFPPQLLYIPPTASRDLPRTSTHSMPTAPSPDRHAVMSPTL